MQLDHDLLAETLLVKSPGWARVGLTAPDSRLRHEAANELARVIIEEISEGRVESDPAQLGMEV